MANNNQKRLTREEAEELYRDLQKSMSQILKNTSDPSSIQTIRPQESKKVSSVYTKSSSPAKVSLGSVPRFVGGSNRGTMAAAFVIISCAIIRIALSIFDTLGVFSVEKAQASIASPSQIQSPEFTREELEVLTSLDARRAELDDRTKRVANREKDLEAREREFQTKLTELRELTGRLKLDRDKMEKKQLSQLEQLANVYNAMNPTEAARLLEQLDLAIALSLFERMPEKKIGQILPLMSPNKALTITQMLSGKKGY